LTPGTVISPIRDPNLPATQSWRVEFQMHNWALPAAGGGAQVWGLNGIGASASLLIGGVLRFIDTRDQLPGGAPCDLPLTGLSNVLVRVQRDALNKRFVCELWNYDGTGHQQNSVQISSFLQWPYSDGGFGSANTSAALGFFRIFDNVVPDGSQPPVTADTGNLLNLKLDRSLVDTGPRGLSNTSSNAVYGTTPSQLPAAFIKTADAPAWTDWVSLRAGYPAALDGSRSFSLADASSAVTYKWQQLSGPSTLRWSSYTSATPTVRGLIFGTYRLQLQVTDVNGTRATKTLDVGAVATDDNGVVVQANPAADLIFGPMIAFGKNPWSFQDQMTIRAATVRAPQLNSLTPPSWAGDLGGTISYVPAGASQAAQTTLSAPLGASDMTLQLADATKLDLTSMPTMVMVLNPGGWSYYEEIHICSVSGNVLNVCYDGRAMHAGQYQEVASPQAWAAGSTVTQIKTVGTSTSFLADFCPAGPGEEGQVAYSDGTVSVQAGNSVLTGNATSWGGSLESLRVRIQGTHSGIPFVFFASVKSVDSPTSITLGRGWPVDADTATGLTYSIIRPSRSIVRHWTRPDGTIGQQAESVSSCESDTQMYHSNIFSYILGPQTNRTYSFWNGIWFSDYGPNYYDEVLGEYAGYFRSGYKLFLSNARAIGDYWPKSPDFDEGWLGVAPRRTGATGMVAGAVLDGRASNWYALRRLATSAAANNYVTNANHTLLNCDADVRESSYQLSWIALAAMFDPDSASRQTWQKTLDTTYERDNACKGPKNEFPTIFTAASGSYNLTNGSAAVTGQGISQSLCPITVTGIIAVTKGSTVATGTGFVPDAKIVIPGTLNGSQYLYRSLFTVVSPTVISLASPYDGDSGTYSYQIEPDQYSLSFINYADQTTNISKFHSDANYYFSCVWNNAQQITLDHPWPGQTGTYGVQRYNEIGYGTEPFFDGIKTFAMRYASLGATGDTAAKYASLANATATYVLTEGFDPTSGGLHYATEWGICLPENHPKLGCTYDASSSGSQAARTLNAEAQNAMGLAYLANPTPQNKAFGDQFYAAQWGKLGGPGSDGTYLNALDGDNIWSYKWLGFLFGIGMSHQWPAVRLGGVQPAVPVSSSISLDIPGAGAVSAKILVTQPSGAKQLFNCSDSPCQITVDRRQGAHWYQIAYFDAEGKLLSQGHPDLLEVQ
jgi:hypothetical protein